MGDFYAEKLVKKKTTGKDILIKCLMAALTVIAVFSFFVMPFGIFVVFLIIGLDIFIFRSLDVEYEYQYINGDIDIDKIMHKERRKNVFSANIKDMELLAPSGNSQTYGKSARRRAGQIPRVLFSNRRKTACASACPAFPFAEGYSRRKQRR